MKWIINKFPDDKSQRNIRDKGKERKERKEGRRQVQGAGQREDEEDRETEVEDKQRE